MLYYNQFIFEKKLDNIFLNINESILPSNYKTILNKLIDLLNNNLTINNLIKVINKIYNNISNINIRKKILYVIIFTFFIPLNLNNIDISAMSINNTDEIETIVKSIEKIKLKDGFLKYLAFKESSNNWKRIRYKYKNGKKIPLYVGKYQFGNLAFKDINSNITVQEFAKNPNIWTEKQQDKDILKLISNNKHYLRKTSTFKGIDYYVGQNINGINITESGIIAAAHLVGSHSVREFLRSNGKNDRKDANGISCSNYMREFENYKLPI